MIWLTGDEWHIRSKCGHYTVSRATVAGEPRYTAWFLKASGQPPKHLGVGSTPGIAKVICEKHESTELVA